MHLRFLTLIDGLYSMLQDKCFGIKFWLKNGYFWYDFLEPFWSGHISPNLLMDLPTDSTKLLARLDEKIRQDRKRSVYPKQVRKHLSKCPSCRQRIKTEKEHLAAALNQLKNQTLFDID